MAEEYRAPTPDSGFALLRFSLALQILGAFVGSSL